MTVNLNEATQAIKRAGSHNVRIVPMDGQTVQGQQKIEVRENGAWHIVVEGISRQMADDLVTQATNRVILG